MQQKNVRVAAAYSIIGNAGAAALGHSRAGGQIYSWEYQYVYRRFPSPWADRREATPQEEEPGCPPDSIRHSISRLNSNHQEPRQHDITRKERRLPPRMIMIRNRRRASRSSLDCARRRATTSCETEPAHQKKRKNDNTLLCRVDMCARIPAPHNHVIPVQKTMSEDASMGSPPHTAFALPFSLSLSLSHPSNFCQSTWEVQRWWGYATSYGIGEPPQQPAYAGSSGRQMGILLLSRAPRHASEDRTCHQSRSEGGERV